MGYRHQVISDTMIPAKWPRWFIDKYSSLIDFDRNYWASKHEFKRYGVLEDFETDIQCAMEELAATGDLDYSEVRLVFFADESSNERPDISHVVITQNSIIEITPTDWEAA